MLYVGSCQILEKITNPEKDHWVAVKWILHHLKGGLDMCLMFGGTDRALYGYTDADMAGDVVQRKSTSVYLFTFAGGGVSWQSSLQKCVAISTIEVEYIAAVKAKKMMWLQ